MHDPHLPPPRTGVHEPATASFFNPSTHHTPTTQYGATGSSLTTTTTTTTNTTATTPFGTASSTPHAFLPPPSTAAARLPAAVVVQGDAEKTSFRRWKWDAATLTALPRGGAASAGAATIAAGPSGVGGPAAGITAAAAAAAAAAAPGTLPHGGGDGSSSSSGGGGFGAVPGVGGYGAAPHAGGGVRGRKDVTAAAMDALETETMLLAMMPRMADAKPAAAAAAAAFRAVAPFLSAEDRSAMRALFATKAPEECLAAVVDVAKRAGQMARQAEMDGAAGGRMAGAKSLHGAAPFQVHAPAFGAFPWSAATQQGTQHLVQQRRQQQLQQHGVAHHVPGVDVRNPHFLAPALPHHAMPSAPRFQASARGGGDSGGLRPLQHQPRFVAAGLTPSLEGMAVRENSGVGEEIDASRRSPGASPVGSRSPLDGVSSAGRSPLNGHGAPSAASTGSRGNVGARAASAFGHSLFTLDASPGASPNFDFSATRGAQSASLDTMPGGPLSQVPRLGQQNQQASPGSDLGTSNPGSHAARHGAQGAGAGGVDDADGSGHTQSGGMSVARTLWGGQIPAVSSSAAWSVGGMSPSASESNLGGAVDSGVSAAEPPHSASGARVWSSFGTPVGASSSAALSSALSSSPRTSNGVADMASSDPVQWSSAIERSTPRLDANAPAFTMGQFQQK